jgi:radical SAM protein with 4Fe4S-binding SPASM domain
MLTSARMTASKELTYFRPFNHKRIISIIEAGRDPDRLKDIPPIYLNLDMTWRCNYDCIGCIDGGVVGRDQLLKNSNNQLDLDWEVCQDLLRYAKENQLLGFIVQGGEPLLYPHIDNFLYACADDNLVVRLVTNGSQITQHSDSLLAVLKHAGASMRVSINANRENYQRFVRSGEGNYDEVLKGINTVSARGGKVVVSMVVFGSNFGAFSNIEQISNVIRDSASAGATIFILLPGRDPLNKAMLPFEDDEMAILKEIVSGPVEKMNVFLGGRFFLEESNPASEQNKHYTPCATGLMRIVVGSDGSLYTCTEHRGEKGAIIGKISPDDPFEKIWHSRERAEKQVAFDPAKKCKRITCDRYGINVTVELARSSVDRFHYTDFIRFLLSPEENVPDPFF